MPEWVLWIFAVLGSIGGLWVLYWAYEKIRGRRKEQQRRQDEALRLCDSIKKRLGSSPGNLEPLCNANKNTIDDLLQSIKENLSSGQK
jgi:hypothetical protein